MAKSSSRKILQGDRCKHLVAGVEGTITLIKKGLLKYSITWDNGRTEDYTTKEFSKWCEVLPPEPEDIEEEELGLFDGDFSREKWKDGDRIQLKHTKLGATILSLEQGLVRWGDGKVTAHTISETYFEKCSDNLTCAAVSASDSPLPDCSSENSISLGFVSGTNIAETSSSSDIQESKLPQTSGICAGITPPLHTPLLETGGEENSIYLVQARPANHLACKESALEDTTSETASPLLSKSLESLSQNSSALKTFEDSSAAHTSQEENSSIFNGCLPGFTSAGTMQNGLLSAQDTLDRPGLESDYFWLDSPGALSSVGRSPGRDRLSSQLAANGILLKGECMNPRSLERGFNLPLEWTNLSESRTAAQLLAAEEKPSETVSIPELLPQHSEESSTSTTSFKTEGELTPDPKLIGKHFWCDHLDIVVTITKLQNWREKPRSPIIPGARVSPWWSAYPDDFVVCLSDLEEIEEFSCPFSLEKSGESPINPITGFSPDSQSPIIGSSSNSKQTGSLYQYTANKADKTGVIQCYPKVEGDRKREEDSHWYWGLSYVEKENGKWRDKSAAVPRKKLSEVRAALRNGKPYTYILRKILGKD